jgi:hypothetical protein
MTRGMDMECEATWVQKFPARLHAYLDRVAGERPATMAVPGRP